jgi:Uma2 family endonuclease
MTDLSQLMTADELIRLPRGRARHELVRGVLRTMPLHVMEHGHIASVIGGSLVRHVEAYQLGEVVGSAGFQLTSDPDTVRAAAVSFIRPERIPVGEDRWGYVHGAPDLAVEIVSPEGRRGEVDERVGEWLEYGARLVFVVNPRRQTVAVHRPGQTVSILGIDDVLSGEDVVPGWTIPIRDLFDRRRRQRS